MREPQILSSAKVFLFKAAETNHVQNIAGVDIPPKKDLSTAGWSNVDTLSRLFLGPEKYWSGCMVGKRWEKCSLWKFNSWMRSSILAMCTIHALRFQGCLGKWVKALKSRSLIRRLRTSDHHGVAWVNEAMEVWNPILFEGFWSQFWWLKRVGNPPSFKDVHFG